MSTPVEFERSMEKNKIVVNELLDWAFHNFVMPALIPIAFVWCLGTFFIRIDTSVGSLFHILLRSGVYVFLGLSVQISLFHDRKKAIHLFVSPLYTLLLPLSIIATGLIFTSSLNLAISDQAIPYEENMWTAMWFSIMGLAVSSYLKYKILKSVTFNM
jgi:hypothetical protein